MPKHTRREYNRHLKSPAYRKLRGQVIYRDNGECQAIIGNRKCCSRIGIEVHHLTYERFGNELLSDLITLCRRCHSEIDNHHLKQNRGK